MSLKVQRGKHEFLAHDGVINMVVSYALRRLKHRIIWVDFINMDTQYFDELLEARSEEERNKGEEPKRVTKPKKEKQQKRGENQKIDE
jgi:hypothetical protein